MLSGTPRSIWPIPRGKIPRGVPLGMTDVTVLSRRWLRNRARCRSFPRISERANGRLSIRTRRHLKPLRPVVIAEHIREVNLDDMARFAGIDRQSRGEKFFLPIVSVSDLFAVEFHADARCEDAAAVFAPPVG